MARQIRVKDLKPQVGHPFPRPMLLCDDCGGEYSADRADYFAADPDTVIRCCGKPVQLVTKRTMYAHAS